MVVFREAKLNGVVHSTDEFFVKNGKYVYDNSRLQEAHEWNHRKGLTLLLTNHTFMCYKTSFSVYLPRLFLARESAERQKNPIIIDNTHTQAWEMRYYIVLVRNHLTLKKNQVGFS